MPSTRVKAREDEERLRNEVETYANDILSVRVARQRAHRRGERLPGADDRAGRR